MKTLDFLSAVEREEIRRYLRLCALVQARMEKGESLNRAVRHFVNLYRGGRPFRCDPNRVFKFSKNTLRRKLEAWRRNPSPLGLLKGGGVPRSQAPAALRLALLRRCLQPGVESVADVLQSFEVEWRRGKRVPGAGRNLSGVELCDVPGFSRRNLRRALADALPAGGMEILQKHFALERAGRKQFARVQALIAREVERARRPRGDGKR